MASHTLVAVTITTIRMMSFAFGLVMLVMMMEGLIHELYRSRFRTKGLILGFIPSAISCVIMLKILDICKREFKQGSALMRVSKYIPCRKFTFKNLEDLPATKFSMW